MEKNLFTNLLQLIKHPESFFDDGIACYIIDRLNSESLQNTLFNIDELKNFQLEANILGLILNKNKSTLLTDNSSISQTKIEEEQKNWLEILKNKDNNLIKNPVFKLKARINTTKIKEQDISLSTILALIDIKNWYKLNKEGKYTVPNKEEYLIIKDLIEKEQKYMIVPTDLEKNPEMLDFFMTKLLDNIREVKNTFKLNDEEILNKLLNSKNIKTLVSKSPTHFLEKLFNTDALKSLYKKSSLASNLIQHPDMLSSVLPLATPKKWIEIIYENEKINLLSFFGPLIHRGTGYSVSSIEKSIKNYKNPNSRYWEEVKRTSRYSNIAKEILNRIIYFEEEFKTIELKPIELQQWYIAVILTKNKDLYLKSREIFPLPEKTIENNFLFNKIITQEHINWETEYQKNKLEKLLSNKSENIKLKVKI